MAIRDLAALPARCRSRFPIFERQVYVNSCSQGALSDAVRASYEQYLTDWDEHGAPWEYWVERTEAARAAFAKRSPKQIWNSRRNTRRRRSTPSAAPRNESRLSLDRT